MENDGRRLGCSQYEREKIQPTTVSGKEITSADREGYRFFLSLGIALFSIFVMGATWGVASNIAPSYMGWACTWIFWVWLGAVIGLGIPYIVWRANRYGVFED